MKKYLCEYRAFIKSIIDNDTELNYKEILEYHNKQIQFFQHERLIHLIVTVLFAILLVSSVFVIVIAKVIEILPLALLFLILIIPYIKHYYFLENQVQALYDDYNKLFEKVYGFNYKTKISK